MVGCGSMWWCDVIGSLFKVVFVSGPFYSKHRKRHRCVTLFPATILQQSDRQIDCRNLKSTAEISNRLPLISNRLPIVSNRLPKSRIDCRNLKSTYNSDIYRYIYIIIEQHTAAAAAVAAAASRLAWSAAPWPRWPGVPPTGLVGAPLLLLLLLPLYVVI